MTSAPRYLVRVDDRETQSDLGPIRLVSGTPGERTEIVPDAEWTFRGTPLRYIRESDARALDGHGYVIFDERDAAELARMAV